MHVRRLILLLPGLCLLLVGSLTVVAQADPPAQPGTFAPDFVLRDTAGQQHRLADYVGAGKIVVLEWFSPDCGACMDYYYPGEDEGPSAMEQLVRSVAGPDLVWLTVNSSAPGSPGAGLAVNAQAQAEWRMSTPLLLDEDGSVGRSFGATYTPTLCIVSADGFFAYRGAPDDDGVDGSWDGIEFVQRAVAQLRAGQEVTIMETAPFGCPIEYADGAAE